MAIGMSYDDYWNGDCEMTRAYLKAHKLKKQMENEKMWLQGLYIYDALCDVSPILRALPEKGAKPLPYPSKPYPLTKDKAKAEEEAQAKALMEKGRASMMAWMNKVNGTRKKIKEEVGMDGRND